MNSASLSFKESKESKSQVAIQANLPSKPSLIHSSVMFQTTIAACNEQSDLQQIQGGQQIALKSSIIEKQLLCIGDPKTPSLQTQFTRSKNLLASLNLLVIQAYHPVGALNPCIPQPVAPAWQTVPPSFD